MSYEAVVAIILGINLGAAVLCAFIAARRGRDVFSWVLTGALIGPFALLALLASPNRIDSPIRDQSQSTSAGGHRVVVPVDGSQGSLRAVERAVAILPPGASISLLTVLPVELADDTQQPTASRERTEVERQIDERFREARNILTAAGVRFHTATLFGSPADEILRFAETGASMIVMGRRGGGLTKALLGSVSDKVVRNSDCPVTVV